ncbi:hypothetical protein BC827DRAFT_1195492 [Russula dissimulans]|nr:hypothetical protein BC827DRAFT_1195492 [Russula dissimulans]
MNSLPNQANTHTASRHSLLELETDQVASNPMTISYIISPELYKHGKVLHMVDTHSLIAAIHNIFCEQVRVLLHIIIARYRHPNQDNTWRANVALVYHAAGLSHKPTLCIMYTCSEVLREVLYPEAHDNGFKKKGWLRFTRRQSWIVGLNLAERGDSIFGFQRW